MTIHLVLVLAARKFFPLRAQYFENGNLEDMNKMLIYQKKNLQNSKFKINKLTCF